MNASAEIVGLAGGLLNVMSALPVLHDACKQARHRPRDLPQIQSRRIQLLANLLWLVYAVANGLLSVALTTGVMSACLVALLAALGRAGPNLADGALPGTGREG